MIGSTETSLIQALIYADGALADRTLRDAVRHLDASGHRLAGVLQREQPDVDRRRCDMILEDLSTGTTILISQQRGPHARGCRLVVGELLRAMEMVSRALGDAPDLLIVNKFGKTEAEGGGFRPLIAEAIIFGIPVLIAVPYRNLDQWRAFAGDMAEEIHLNAETEFSNGRFASSFRLVRAQGDARTCTGR